LPTLSLCAVALVLLMDSSDSIAPNEFSLQRDATAAALEHPDVVRAIEDVGGVAVLTASFGWKPEIMTPWRIVSDRW